MDVFLTGFPKKLLIAISIVVIIAMCVMPAEGQPIEHKKRHHRRPQAIALTKESETMRRPMENRRRHQKRPENLAQTSKETSGPRRPKVNHADDLFKVATRKILNKLKNTRSYFAEDKKVLNESREYRDGMPSWLPSVNFVAIHDHDFKSAHKTNSTISQRKFAYLMPKLYKSLVEYQEIFKLLLNVELEFQDELFTSYNKTRQDLIQKILQKLYSTITEISVDMSAVKVPLPVIDKSRMNLEKMATKVDATQCLKNDYITFRGYGNLLNNWYFILKCTKNKKTNKKCQAFDRKLKEKKDSRRPRIKANLSSLS